MKVASRAMPEQRFSSHARLAHHSHVDVLVRHPTANFLQLVGPHGSRINENLHSTSPEGHDVTHAGSQGRHAPPGEGKGSRGGRRPIPGQHLFLGTEPVLEIVPIFHPAVDVQLEGSMRVSIVPRMRTSLDTGCFFSAPSSSQAPSQGVRVRSAVSGRLRSPPP